MATRQWSVVVFEATEMEKESVQAVPSTWINGDQCLWPSLPPDKLSVALRKCQFNSCWPSFKVRVLRNGTFDDYSLARKKAKKAEDTSDLTTDTDNQKRVRKSKKKWSDEASNTSEASSSDEGNKRSQYKIPDPPRYYNDQTSCAANNEEDEAEDEKQKEPSRRKGCLEVANNEDDAEGEKEGGFSRMKEKEKISSGSKSKKASQCRSCHRVEKETFAIHQLVMEINSKVDKLILRQNDSNNPMVALDKDILETINSKLPLKTEEELGSFNSLLEAEANFKAMVAYFSKMGGANLSEYIRRTMGNLINDELACKFSLKGRKMKSPFDGHLIYKLIVDAAEKTGLATNRKDIESAVGVWLKRANERKRRENVKAAPRAE